MKPVYSVYPSLLNDFVSYLTEDGYEKDDEHVCFVPDETNLIDRINRVKAPATEAQASGQAFEDMVLNRIPFDAKYGSTIDAVEGAQLQIPMYHFDNVRCIGAYDFGSFIVCIYGIMDVFGAGHVIDLKRTKSYSLTKYYSSHQLFYLLNCEHVGAKKMSFVVNSNNHIYTETYKGNDIDWYLKFTQVKQFIDFVNDYKHLITDKKIFQDARKEEWIQGCFGYGQPEIKARFI